MLQAVRGAHLDPCSLLAQEIHFLFQYTEAEIQVVSPRLIQKHYTNAPRIAMVVQQSKIKCRTQVYRFRAHSLTQSIAMIKKSFKNSEKTQKCTKKMPFFHD